MKRFAAGVSALVCVVIACGETANKPGASGAGASSAGMIGTPEAGAGGSNAASGGGSGGKANGGAAASTAGAEAEAGVGNGGEPQGEGGSVCEPTPSVPAACADAIEGGFLQRFIASFHGEEAPGAGFSEIEGLDGGKALRFDTEAAFEVSLRFSPETALVGTAASELRLLVRAKNTNTGWQGNVPVITLEDSAGKRRAYAPARVLYPTDGNTWNEIRVPLSGGAGYVTSGDEIDFGNIRSIELTADTWESGFVIDLDGLGIVAAGTTCAASCKNDCSGRGVCSSVTRGCECEVGAVGDDCSSCRSGFAPENGHCALENDGDFDSWPNAASQVNGDAWLQVHHAQIKTLAPRLLVLNFANPSDPAEVDDLVGDVIGGFREGSRPLGVGAPGLDYDLLNIVDLRDGVGGRPAPPNDFAYENSTLYPRRGQGEAGAWGLDYAALFDDAFAKYLGFEDPNAPGEYLGLCELIESGRIHELWLVGSGDVPDSNAAEVLEHKQRYDSSRNPIAGSFDSCAGNGCFDSDVPRCARSLRIGFVNYNRGPGCYLHSQGHGLESTAQRAVVPALSRWFLPFAGFDLDRRYGLAGSSFYALVGDGDSLEYATPSKLRVKKQGDVSQEVAGYVASCGNVHFPPNAGSHYDYASSTVVSSDCADFGRNVQQCRPRAVQSVSASMWQQYDALAPDCGGGFLVYWYQHMPGFGSPMAFDEGQPMLPVWPFLFY